MIELCAFADEASACFTEQLSVLKEHGISKIELRGLDGKNVSKLTDDEAFAYAAQLRASGIGVWSIGSPLGKVPLSSAKEHMTEVRRVCELAQIFGARRVRMFSFYEAGEEKEAVIEALREMTEIANSYGVVLCHENEKGIYGDTPARVCEILDALPSLRSVFDPANYIQCGVSVPDALNTLFARTDYFHVKDVVSATGELVPAGYGDGAIAALIAAITASGRDAVLTVEPHLRSFDGYAEIDGEEMKHRFHFKNGKESFAAAVNALKELLRAQGLREAQIDQTRKGWYTV